MYASLPLSCPSRVVCARPAALATPKSRTRATPSAPDEDVLRRHVAVDDAERRARSSRRLVRGVQPVERAADDRRARCAAGPARPSLAVARMSRASDSPCTYSMTRKSSPSVATTSSVGTTLGWRMRAASRASSRNIGEVGIARELGVQALDRDGAREAGRAEEAPEVDGGHATGGDDAVDGITAGDAHGRLRRRGAPPPGGADSHLPHHER